MQTKQIPIWLRHAPAPSVRGFATLAGIEAVVRGILISVFPLAMFSALQDAKAVSSAYFFVGIASLLGGLSIPFLTRFVPRRFVYSAGATMFVAGSLLAIHGTPATIVTGLFLNALGTVTTFICFNAYVLDYVAKMELKTAETTRMFYSGLGWTIGPALGVMLTKWWAPAPFIISATAATCMLCLFLYMRLGNGKLITRARSKTPNPLALLPRFVAQPRLVAGWTFAVIRSCGWWVYVVYLPIFAIENGLGDQLGGIVLSITNATLFLTPFMLRWMKKRTIRVAVRTGFFVAGSLFCIAGIAAGFPWVSVACLLVASFFLILLDISAGLPFLMAVKPSERTEMSAIYSSYRDVSGIITPGATWFVLLVSPLSGLFLAAGVSLFAAWHLASKLSPRLGEERLKMQPLSASHELPVTSQTG